MPQAAHSFNHHHCSPQDKGDGTFHPPTQPRGGKRELPTSNESDGFQSIGSIWCA